MATAVVMPKAGITVESCIIGVWEKKVGDQIKVGDILFSYETDKASFECESTAEGELLEIFYGDGEEVTCLKNVCAIGTHGEDVSALRPAGDGAPSVESTQQENAGPESPAEKSVETNIGITASAEASDKAGVGGPPALSEVSELSAAASPDQAQASRRFDGSGVAVTTLPNKISPRARKLAAEVGIDLAAVVASGPSGRVIERDIRLLIEQGAPALAPARPAAAPAAAPVAAAPAYAPAPSVPAPGETYEDVKFSGIRKAISRSMATSLSTIAQLTHNFSFDATTLLECRKAFKNCEGDLAGITIGDMILFAVSRTLPEYPDLNAHMLDDATIRRFDHVNIGVATDTERGLMVPTIFHAETMSLLDISREVKALAGQAREGSISPDKLAGGTFTVSNLGSFGVESFTPVINPPQTGLIGVCTTVDRVRKNADGSSDIYPAMTLSLTYDHRAIDGAPASRFMMKLCERLEHFTTLLSM